MEKHLPSIDFKVIPHKKMRYDTCGDYFFSEGKLKFRVSKTNGDYEFLILIHEMIEWHLTQKKGISIKEIDKFDKAFEKKRQKGNLDEPGNDPNAPYHHEHQFATFMEKWIADYMNIEWDEYSKVIDEL